MTRTPIGGHALTETPMDGLAMTKTPQRRSACEDGGSLQNAGVFVLARLG